jgi:hypothetical protein
MPIGRSLSCLLALAAWNLQHIHAASWSWQQPHATVSSTGDLSWSPEPFRYQAGSIVRYIDYEHGDDSDPGTRERPWRHHPWDERAAGLATEDPNGPVTYVFKRGVVYRGALSGGGQGTLREPIRLTSDPSWGSGEAIIAGSHVVAGGWQQGGAGLPEAVPEREQIWYVDLPQGVEPRCIWALDDDGIQRLILARTPNWREGDDDQDDLKRDWFEFSETQQKVEHDGILKNLGQLDASLPRDPAYYEGAIIRADWGPVMGSAAPVPIDLYDPEAHTVIFHPFFPRGKQKIFSGSRYSLEDNPHYLDQDGEFWFDDEGEHQGRLYLRLPNGGDPNALRIEVGARTNLIRLVGSSHLEISGLGFRYTNMPPRDEWPWFAQPEVIHLRGGGSDIRISHNRFVHVNSAVDIAPGGIDQHLDRIVISDNEILYTDQGAIQVTEGKPEQKFGPYGQIGDLRILRNRIYRAGLWPDRMSHGHCISVRGGETVEIAGNIVHRTGGWGISVFGGKNSGTGGSVPFVRYLIHHNEVLDPLLLSNDWGGIETWVGGPFYVYNNVVGNPVGIMGFAKRRFGHAYYLDGAFKNYHFNNIAWAENNDPGSIEASTAAFQEIHSFQNTFFNNTAYNFLVGSRRQNPGAGRDKFLGNIFQDISEKVFRHSDSKNEDPNAHHAGEQGEHFAYETNAYSRNVLYDIGGTVGNFHALGGDHPNLTSFAEALASVDTMAADAGIYARRSPLIDPAGGDFRPTPESIAIDTGVRVFVPWALSGVVGEWHFTRNRMDPNAVIDEHWFMRDYYLSRTDYHAMPTYPLIGQGIAATDYVAGVLEDWTHGALRLNGQDQYLAVNGEQLAEAITYPGGRDQPERIAEGADKATLDMQDNDFLIEVFLRTEDTDGCILQKLSPENGYALDIVDGRPRLRLRTGGTDVYTLTSTQGIADDRWHHVIAEVDRSGTAMLFIDGRAVAAIAQGSMPTGSLSNRADVLVGGGPDTVALAATLDFLRVARGTLDAAKTNIEELYAWQFDGPQFRDFNGRLPTGERRDAGAIEAD